MSEAPPLNGRVTPGTFLNGVPRVRNSYRPHAFGGNWLGRLIDGRPIFTFLEAERMRRDPRIDFGLRILRAPLYRCQWETLAAHPRIQRFVDELTHNFWDDTLRRTSTAAFTYGPAVRGGDAPGQPRARRLRPVRRRVPAGRPAPGGRARAPARPLGRAADRRRGTAGGGPYKGGPADVDCATHGRTDVEPRTLCGSPGSRSSGLGLGPAPHGRGARAVAGEAGQGRGDRISPAVVQEVRVPGRVIRHPMGKTEYALRRHVDRRGQRGPGPAAGSRSSRTAGS
jgi:hypothetical protein